MKCGFRAGTFQMGAPPADPAVVATGRRRCGRGSRAGGADVDGVRRPCHRGWRCVVQVRVLRKNGAFQLLQRPTRFDTHLVRERPPGTAVGIQRVGLPPRAIQAHHQLLVQPLVQRMPGDQALQFPDEFGVPTHHQIGLDPGDHHVHPLFGQSRDLGLRERQRHELGQRRSPPQLQRLGEPGRGHVRCGRQRLGALPGQSFEPQQIHALRVQLQHIPRPAPLQRAAGRRSGPVPQQRLPQPGHTHMNTAGRLVRRLRTPQPVHQGIHRHHSVEVQHQHRQHRGRPDSTQRQFLARVPHLQRTQHPDVHAGLPACRAEPAPAPTSPARTNPTNAANSYPNTTSRCPRADLDRGVGGCVAVGKSAERSSQGSCRGSPEKWRNQR